MLTSAETRRAETLFSYAPVDAPSANELEVTLLGPGFGESAVIHIGNGRWIIVDSCRHRKLNLALAYLDYLSVDVANAVDRVVVSHWHKDHVDGLGRLVRECSSALLVAAAALNTKEVYRAIYKKSELLRDERRFDKGRPTVVEYAEAMDVMKERENSREAMIWAGARTRVYDEPEKAPDVFIDAWSPSAYAHGACNSRIADLCISLAMDEPKLPPGINPNSLSIVLFVQAGERKLVLGADLEGESGAARGWNSVSTIASTRLQGQTDVLKIPHHGSVTADDTALWRLSGAVSHGLLAPWQRGNHYLPKDEDVERLRKQLDECFLTAPAPNIAQNGDRMTVSELGSVTLRCQKTGEPRTRIYAAERARRYVRDP